MSQIVERAYGDRPRIIGVAVIVGIVLLVAAVSGGPDENGSQTAAPLGERRVKGSVLDIDR